MPEGTMITPGIAVRGEVSGREDLYVNGEVHGSVRLAEARLTVGPSGRVSADVEATEIIVEGRISGTLVAKTRVVLRSSARVEGKVFSPRLMIEEGAQLRGKVDPEGQPAAASKPARAAADGESVRTIAS
ncbi:MAG TPA: polymer-forming cytoskeletal protein [Candidatus Acidoferrales bacterium]